MTQAFYEMGLALRALSRPRMYRALDYGSFAELLEDREVTSRFTAMKLISIVDNLERETALSLGVEKSYAFIRYVRSTRPNVDVGRLAARNPSIREVGVRLGDISTRDLYALAKRRRGGSVDDAAARRASTLAKKLQRTLRAHDIDGARVRADAKGSRPVVRVELSPEDARALVVLLGR